MKMRDAGVGGAREGWRAGGGEGSESEDA